MEKYGHKEQVFAPITPKQGYCEVTKQAFFLQVID